MALRHSGIQSHSEGLASPKKSLRILGIRELNVVGIGNPSIAIFKRIG